MTAPPNAHNKSFSELATLIILPDVYKKSKYLFRFSAYYFFNLSSIWGLRCSTYSSTGSRLTTEANSVKKL